MPKTRSGEKISLQRIIRQSFQISGSMTSRNGIGEPKEVEFQERKQRHWGSNTAKKSSNREDRKSEYSEVKVRVMAVLTKPVWRWWGWRSDQSRVNGRQSDARQLWTTLETPPWAERGTGAASRGGEWDTENDHHHQRSGQKRLCCCRLLSFWEFWSEALGEGYRLLNWEVIKGY